LKIVVLGDSGVGKTSLINSYVTKKFTSHYKATIGSDFITKEIMVDERLVTLQIWDTAGQERFASLGRAFYRGADCCVLVYDVNNAETFNDIDNWYQDFLLQGQPSRPEKFPFLLIGNKIDVEKKEMIISNKRITSYCQSKGIVAHFETSAKEGVQVDQAFQKAAKAALEQQSQASVMDDDGIIPLLELDKSPSSTSCSC